MHNGVLPRFLLIGALLLLPTASQAAGPGTNADMRDAALIVGNVLPFGPTDGILRYDGRGVFIDKMVAVGTAGITIPCCMTFGPDENLYVSSPFEGNVQRFNGVTGAFIDTFIPAGRGGLSVPLPLLFKGDYLYVGDTGLGAIRRYDAKTGAFVDNFVPDGSQGMGVLGELQQFAFAPEGDLFVSSMNSNRVLQFDGQTGAFVREFVPASAGFVFPAGLTFGSDKMLYAASSYTGEVRRYDMSTGNFEVFVPGQQPPVVAVGLIFGPDGNLYMAAAGSSQVLRFDGKTGKFLDVFVPAGLGGLVGPRVIEWKTTTTVCHHPGGNPAKAKTLKIGYLSGRDHLAHGDTLGACH